MCSKARAGEKSLLQSGKAVSGEQDAKEMGCAPMLLGRNHAFQPPTTKVARNGPTVDQNRAPCCQNCLKPPRMSQNNGVPTIQVKIEVQKGKPLLGGNTCHMGLHGSHYLRLSWWIYS